MLIALRMLSHEKGRSALAVCGIAVAVLLIFLQLGFYFSVPRGGMLVYDAMRFDVLLVSPDYAFQGESSAFPRRRLSQALALDDVTAAMAFYQASGEWMDASSGIARDVFVMAFDPQETVFDVPDIKRQQAILRLPDRLLVDTSTRKEFGKLTPGRTVEVERRAEQIAGTYQLGTGFVGLGAAVTSDINFARIFPNQGLTEINLGLLTLRQGADATDVVRRLQRILPADTMAMTRADLTAREISYWTTRTSTGLLFGFGAVIAFIVGMVIMNQILSTQILRQLPQYATLKAIGYTDSQLRRIVLSLAAAMAAMGFLPALTLSLVVYAMLRSATLLPIEMTPARIAMVLVISLCMSAASALMSARVLQRADPADLF
jgi:putative ABC transport system permease protein